MNVTPKLTESKRTLGFSMAALATLIVVLLLHTIPLAVIAEDAFISFRFAQNVASGHGFVWNPGQTPVEGYTNFLWVVMAALALRLNLDVLLVSQVLGFFFSALTLVYTFRFGKDFFRFGRKTQLFAPFFLAISGPIATWAGSGMETSMFMFWVLAASYYWVRYATQDTPRDLTISFILLLLASLTRPEGVGIAGTLIVTTLLSPYIKPEENLAPHVPKVQLAKSFAIFYFIPAVIYFVLRYSYFGYLLPNTFYAKTGGGAVLWFRGISYLLYFAFNFILPFALMLWLLRSSRPDNKHTASPDFTASAAKEPFALIIIWSIIIAYSLYVVWTGGDYMAMYRFMVPIMPLIYLLLAAVWYRLWLRATHVKSRFRIQLIAAFAIAVLGTVMQSTPFAYLLPKPDFTHGVYGGVEIERWHSNRLSVLGQFFNEYDAGRNLSVATRAIGAVSYYSELPVYGVHGLVDPEIAHSEVELGYAFPGHEKENWGITLSRSPDIFMFSRALTRTPLGMPDHDDYKIERLLEKEYELVARWIEDPLNDEEGFFTFLQKKSLE